MQNKLLVDIKILDLMAWLKTQDQSFIEESMNTTSLQKHKKKLYQENYHVIILEFELMPVIGESKHQFYVCFLHIVHDPEHFSSRVQSSMHNWVC